MIRTISSEEELSFLRISEMYPDEYILARIVEIDHSVGKETGIVLCVSESRNELNSFAKNENIIEETIVIEGDNLTPVLGGLL